MWKQQNTIRRTRNFCWSSSQESYIMKSWVIRRCCLTFCSGSVMGLQQPSSPDLFKPISSLKPSPKAGSGLSSLHSPPWLAMDRSSHFACLCSTRFRYGFKDFYILPGDYLFCIWHLAHTGPGRIVTQSNFQRKKVIRKASLRVR